MVAIISGNQFGLLNSSAATLGQAGVFGNAQLGNAKEAAYVNVSNGNLVLQDKDDFVVSLGKDIALTRTYNSQGTINDGNGAQWKLGMLKQVKNLTGTVNTVGSTVIRVDGDGSLAVYTYDATRNAYINTDGAGAYQSLKYDAVSRQWTWTADRYNNNGVSEAYDNSGRIVAVKDNTGGANLSLTYEYNGANLSRIIDASGDKTYFDFSNGNLVAIRTRTAANPTVDFVRVRYEYDASNRLKKVITDLTPENSTDSKTYWTSYAYADTSSRITSIEQSDGSKLSFLHEQIDGVGPWRVTKVTDGESRVTKYDYSVPGKTKVTDPLGNQLQFSYDAQGQLTELTAAAVNGVSQITRYSYDSLGNVSSMTDARGLKTVYAYDANGNRIFERDAAGNTIRRSFDSISNNLLSETKYAVADPDGDGAAQASEALTTRYIYDSLDRLHFTVSAEGRVQAFLYDGLGQLSTTRSYVENRYLGSSFDDGDLVMWFSLTNLNKAQSIRVDYAYDARGQVTSKTTYANVDTDGKGILDGKQSVQQFVYDQAGNLLQSIDGRGISTSYTYDGLGRMLTSTDAANRQTINTYTDDGLGGRFSTTLANGLITTSVQDKSGRVLQQLQSSASANLSTARNVYDIGERLVRTEMQNAQNSYLVYDAAGRKVGVIDENKFLTEYFYNADDQVSKTVRYATAVNKNWLNASGDFTTSAIADLRPSANAFDRTSWNVYDAAGRLVQSIDAAGALKQYTYDGLSRLVRVTEFATRLDLNSLANTNVPNLLSVASSVDDRISRNFYDKDSNLLGSLDADGYLTEYTYNGVNQLTGSIRYANPANAAALANGNLAALRPAESLDDQRQRNFYNAKNQLIASLDAENYRTEMSYDANGNLVSRKRLANNTSYNSSLDDQTTLYSYNALNQLSVEAFADGSINLYTYDSIGKLVATRQTLGSLVVGDSAANVLKGSSTNDVLIGGADNDNIDGAGGSDTAVYLGNFADYRFTYSAGVLTVRDVNLANGDEGSDTLKNIKTLRFADRDVTLVDGLRYIASYDDLISSYGTDADAGIQHFLQTGVSQGRSEIFNAQDYLNRYDDLRASFGTDQSAATVHFISNRGNKIREKTFTSLGNFADYSFAYAAGKLTITNKNLANGDPLTRQETNVKLLRFKDRDLRLVDGLRYIASYPDLIAGFQTNADAGISHFLNTGVKEGRTVSFEPAAYLAKYPDLQVVYGKDLYATTLHYIQQGFAQGRNDNAGLTGELISEDRSTLSRYDLQGRLIAQLTGDGASRLLQAVNASNEEKERIWSQFSVRFSYDNDGLRTSSLDQNGRRSLVFYDAAGRITHVVNALGEVTENVYKSFNQVEQVRQYANRLTSAQLATLSGGKLKQADLDVFKALANDSLDSITSNLYDQRGQVIDQTDALGFHTLNQYNAFGELISNSVQKTDKSGYIAPTTMQYDKRGNLVKKLPFNKLSFATSSVYDAFGRVTTTYDGNGNPRNIEYDRLGRVVVERDGNNARTSTTYDAFSRVKTQTDALTNTTSYSYNTKERSFTITSAENVSHTTKKTRFGETLIARVGEFDETVFNYDKNGNLLNVKDALGTRSAQDVDRAGLVTRIVDANGNLTFIEYDAANRVLNRIVDPNGLKLKTTYSYDTAGRVLTITDPRGVITQNGYDKEGQLTSILSDKGGANLLTRYTYDSRGNTVNTIDANNQLVSDWTSDAIFANAKVVDWDGAHLVVYQVNDAAGNLILRAEGRYLTDLQKYQSITRYAYNANNQLVYELDAEGGVTNYVYDQNQRLVKTTRFAARSSLITANTPWSQTFSAAEIAASVSANPSRDASTRTVYNKDGQVFATIDAAGMLTVNQKFDDEGRVIERVTYAKALDTSKLSDGLTVDAVKTLISQLSDPSHDQRQIMVYDARGRAIASANAQGSQWTVQSSSYDANGNLIGRIRFANSLNISYPSQTQIKDFIAAANSRSAADNVVRMSYDSANRLSVTATMRNATSGGNYAWAISRQSYDNNGNVVARTDYLTPLEAVDATPALIANFLSTASNPLDRQTRFAYDKLNRLEATANALGVDGSGVMRWAVVKQQYDNVGNVIARTEFVNSASSAGSSTNPSDANFNSWILASVTADPTRDRLTRFAYDGANRLVLTLDASGSLSKAFYDANSNLVKSVRYATPVTLAGMLSLNYVPVESAGSDQVSRTVYDLENRPIYQIDSQGAVTERSYNGLGQAWKLVRYATSINPNSLANNSKPADIALLLKADASRDQVTRFAFDAAGNKQFVVDASGAITQYQYDAMGKVLKTWGYSQTASINDATLAADLAREAQQQAANAVTNIYNYDAHGNLVSRTDGMNQSEYFYYDALDRKIGWQNKLGEMWNYEYDAAGNLSAEIAPNAQVADGFGGVSAKRIVTSYSYNALGDLARKTEAAGLPSARSTVFSYDAARRLIASASMQNLRGDGSAEWAVVSQTYDNLGNVNSRLAFSNPLLAAPSLSNSALSSSINSFVADSSKRSSADQFSQFVYDKQQRLIASVTQMQDANGVVKLSLVRQEYDTFGNLSIRTEHANWLRSDITLPAVNAANYLAVLSSATLADNTRDRITRFAYNNLNQVVATVDGVGMLSKYRYDTFGNRIESIAYAKPVTVWPNPINADTSTTPDSSNDRVTRVAYDANNRAVLDIDSLGGVTQRVYDALGNLSKSKRYANPVAMNNLPAQITAANIGLQADAARDRTERTIFDKVGRATFSIDSEGFVKQFQYDALGRVRQSWQYTKPNTVASPNTISDTDLANRLTQIQAQNSTARKQSFDYDARGNLSVSTNALSGSETYTYDALGERASLRDQLNRTWNYTYDLAGNVLIETGPPVASIDENGNSRSASIQTAHSYDMLGKLRSRTEAYGTALARTTRYEYDQAGHQIKTILPTVAVYNGNLASEAQNGATGNASRLEMVPSEISISVTYDALGNAIANRDVGGALSHKTYDQLGRVLTEVDAEYYVTGYERNSFGDVKTLTRYAKRATAPNQLPVADTKNDRNLRYEYDQLGRKLKTIETLAESFDRNTSAGGGFFLSAKTSKMTYDRFGNVLLQSVYGADQNGNPISQAQNTYWSYDGRDKRIGQLNVYQNDAGLQSAYLTRYEYDDAGNLTNQKEFANGYAVSLNPVGLANDFAFNPQSTSQDDREVRTAYDLLNRKVTETQINVLYTRNDVEQRGDLTTGYDYDAVGNQIRLSDALGNQSYNYYDEIGRQVASVVTHQDSTASSLVEMKYDVLGNILRRQEFAKGVTGANLNSYTAAAPDHEENRKTINVFDRTGHLIQETADEGRIRYQSYDVYGRVAKAWQTVTDFTGARQTSYTINAYDKLGRLVKTYTPDVSKDTPDFTVNETEYNSFGEVIAKRIQSKALTTTIMTAEYDQAGHLWRTNEGDGVYKVNLYDAVGNLTLQMRSVDTVQRNVLRDANITTAGQAYELDNLLYSNTRYDLMGRAVDARQLDPHLYFMQRDSNFQWVKMRQAANAPLNDALMVVGTAGEQDRISVLYRQIGSSEWSNNSFARVREANGFVVFSTAGLAQGRYEYRVIAERGASSAEIESGAFETQAANSEDKAKRIIELYNLLLNRTPEPTGLNGFVKRLNNGEDLAQLASEILNSSEAKQRLSGSAEQIIKRRNGVNTDTTFQRDVTRWTQRYTAALAQGGKAAGQIMLDLIDEVALAQKNMVDFAADTPAMQAQTRDYAALFKRWLDVNGIVFEYLVGNRGSETAVANDIFLKAQTNLAAARTALDSAGKFDWSKRQIVQVFVALFAYAPTEVQMNTYMQQLVAGNSVEAVVKGILNSSMAAEFYPSANLSTAQYNEQLLSRAFQTMLGRAPSAQEKQDYLSKLSSNNPNSNAAFALQLVEKVSSYTGGEALAQKECRVFNDKVSLALAFVAQKRSDYLTSRAMLDAVSVASSAAVGVPLALETMAASSAKLGKAEIEKQILDATQKRDAIINAANATPLEATRLRLSRLFVGLLDRAPTVVGLQNLIDRKPANAVDWGYIVNDLINSGEGKVYFTKMVNGASVSLTNPELVRKIYQLAFDVIPSSAKAQEEILQFTAKLDAAGSDANLRGQAILQIIDGMLTSPGISADEINLRAKYDNQAAVGLIFALDLGSDFVQMGRDTLSRVTASNITDALTFALSQLQANVASAAPGIATDASSAQTTQANLYAKIDSQLAAQAAKDALIANEKGALRLQQMATYVGVLGRTAANPLSLSELNSLDAAGTSRNVLLQNYFASSEGLAKFGGLADRDFVNKLYQGILGSSANVSTEAASWAAKLTAKTATRAQVAEGILDEVMADSAAHATDVPYLEGKMRFQQSIQSAMTSLLNDATSQAAAARVTAGETSTVKMKDALDALEGIKKGSVTAVGSAFDALSAPAKLRLQLNLLYATLLQRSAPPTLAEITYQSGGTGDIYKVADDLLRAPEYGEAFLSNDTAFVNKLYERILGRPANIANNEAGFWLDQLRNGPAKGSPYIRGMIAVAMLESYVKNFSDNTPAQLTQKKAFDEKITNFLNAQNAEAQAALATAESNLAKLNGTTKAAQATLDLKDAALKSAKDTLAQLNRDAKDNSDALFLANLANQRAASNVYIRMRGYTDWGGVAFWANRMSIDGVAAVVPGIVGAIISDSYPADNAAFVRKLYNNVLARPDSKITDAEINYWVNFIKQGSTRTSVAMQLLNSPEAASIPSTALDAAMKADPATVNKLIADKAAINIVISKAQTEANAALDAFNLVNQPVLAARKVRDDAQSIVSAMGGLPTVLAKAVQADQDYLAFANRQIAVNQAIALTEKATSLRLVSEAMAANADALQKNVTVFKQAAMTASAQEVNDLTQMYLLLRGRAPRVDELARWIRYEPSQVLAFLLDSDSPRSNDQFVSDVYKFALGRYVAPDEISWWSVKLAGTPPALTRAAFVGEFLKAVKNGNNTDTRLLQAKLQAALGQVANAATNFSNLDASIIGNQQENQNRALIFNANAVAAASNEVSKRSAEIVTLYVSIFNRAPDAALLRYWLGQMNNGASRQQIAQAFIDNSTEGKAQYPSNMSAPDFVAAIYLRGIGRAATASEISEFASQLGSKSRAEVLLAIVDKVKKPALGDLLAQATERLFSGRVNAAQFKVATDQTDSLASLEKAKTLLNDLIKSNLRDAEGVAKGQAVQISNGLRNAGGNLTTLDRWGNIVQSRDLRDMNWVTTYRYNAANQVVMVQVPHAFDVQGKLTYATTSFSYDALGKRVAIQDAMNNINRYDYDGNGNLVRERHADGGVVSYGYNVFGNRTFVQQPDMANQAGVIKHYAYDNLGRLVKTWNSAAVEVWGANDLRGNGSGLDMRARLVTTKVLEEKFDYDELGRRTISTDSAGKETKYGYDLDNNLILVSALLNKDEDVSFDTRDINTITRFGFDAMHHKLWTVDANGNSMSWAYNDKGQLSSHIDMGKVSTIYTYDNAGQQIKQSSSLGQNLVQRYENGLLVEINDLAIKQKTSYRYDLAGNRVEEKMEFTGTSNDTRPPDVGSDNIMQLNRMKYDVQNRLIEVIDSNRFQMNYVYDGNSNRLQVTTKAIKTVSVPDGTFWDDDGVPRPNHKQVDQSNIQVAYHTYDEMNRQLVVNGDLVNGKVVYGKNGHLLAYDKAGNRVSDTYIGTIALVVTDNNGSTNYKAATGETTERFTYDAIGRLSTTTKDNFLVTDIRKYDDASRTVVSGVADAFEGTLTDKLFPNQNKEVYITRTRNLLNLLGISSERRVSSYYRGGQLRRQTSTAAGYGVNSEVHFVREKYDDHRGYDAVGNVLGYTDSKEKLVRWTSYQTEFFVDGKSTQSFDSYQDVKQTTKATNNWVNLGYANLNGDANVALSYYDVNGNRIKVTDQSNGDPVKDRSNLWYDSQGHVLIRKEGDVKTYNLIVNGNVLGAEDWDLKTYLGSTYQQASAVAAAAPAVYSVQRNGETLRSIAQAVWGDSGLWYMIADANGIDENVSLNAGRILQIPIRVNTQHNDASTYKPYNLNEAVGDTSPTPPPNKPDNCGPLGQMIMIVVAVVVTMYTAGAMSGTFATFMETMSAGMTALGGGVAAGGAAITYSGAFIAGVTGSLASQVVGIGMGMQDGLDWKGVALSGIGSAVGMGVGGTLNSAAAVKAGSFLAGSGFTATVGRAIISNVATQAIGVVTHMQDSFSWRNVAAAGASAGMNNLAGDFLGRHNVFGDGYGAGFAREFTSNLFGGAASAAVRKGSFNFANVGLDAFGNTIGNALGGKIQEAEQRRQESAPPATRPEMPEMKTLPTSAPEAFDLARLGDYSLGNVDDDELRGGSGFSRIALRAPMSLEGDSAGLTKLGRDRLRVDSGKGDGSFSDIDAIMRDIKKRNPDAYFPDEVPKSARRAVSQSNRMSHADILSQSANYAESETARLLSSYPAPTDYNQLPDSSFGLVIPISATVAAVGNGFKLGTQNLLLGLAEPGFQIADTIQASLKGLHASVTGDFVNMTPLSQMGATLADTGGGTVEGLGIAAQNVVNMLPPVAAYHVGHNVGGALYSGDPSKIAESSVGALALYGGVRASGMSKITSDQVAQAMGNAARSQLKLFNDQTGKLVPGEPFRFAANEAIGMYSPSRQAAYPFETQNAAPTFNASDIARLSRNNSLPPRADRLLGFDAADIARVSRNNSLPSSVDKLLADRFAPDTMRPGFGLQRGIKPQFNLRRSDFTPEDINWINHKYRVFENRALSGKEVSVMGENVPYRYDRSRRFARDTLAPGTPLSRVKITTLAPGKNVDEYVSRQFGGRQVHDNQNWAPAAANQLMGTLEYNATKHLPTGTPIVGIEINWF